MNCNDLGSVLVCGVPGGPNIPRVPDGNYGVWVLFFSVFFFGGGGLRIGVCWVQEI